MDDNARSALQALLARGQALQDQLRAWEQPGSARLQKLVRAELSFLNRLLSLPLPDVESWPALRSSNLDHLEDVFGILQHPLVSAVSAVMQHFAAGGRDETSIATRRHVLAAKDTAHVDVACLFNGKPVWFIVSSRNPRFIRWLDTGKHAKGLKTRLLVLQRVAYADPVKQPASIFLRFSGELPEEVDRGLKEEFNAVHLLSLSERPSSHSSGDAKDVHLGLANANSDQGWKFSNVEGWEWLDFEVKKDTFCGKEAWVTYEVDPAYFKQGTGIKDRTELSGEVNECTNGKERQTLENDSGACSLSSLSRTSLDQECASLGSAMLLLDRASDQPVAEGAQNLVNLDTTALVALVSELSNGGADGLVALPYEELEHRFPSMHEFIREQGLSELERPLVAEIQQVLAYGQPVVSQYVYDEFLSIVSRVGGPKENARANELLALVRVVPNAPSSRVMALPTSGKIKQRHKIVFGTGDFLNAPTLTANMAFVRAAREKSLLIAVVEHRPRALTGD